MDFFSGSGTTAQACMEANGSDNGNRKFILVQLHEEIAISSCQSNKEKKITRSALQFLDKHHLRHSVCEIGKERIRRAGKKIKEICATTAPDLDIGFRVLKLDSANMEDVYMNPTKFKKKITQGTLNFNGDASLASNVKKDRTAEDLLFQAMLRLDIPLSAKIETEEICGKKVFSVMDGHMLATFDKKVNEKAITAIAKRKPGVFVMCDDGYASDNVADNFEQIWREFSPDTVRRVI